MICCGAVGGCLSILLSKRLITARTENSIEKWYVVGKFAPFLWGLIGSIGFGLIQQFGNNVLQKAELTILLLICLCISAVDFSIRKIPNSLLLVLIISKSVFLASDFSKEELIQSLWGFVFACAVFAIPSFFKISVGAGDMKLAAVSGLYLGINGFLQAMIIMAVTITLYGVYLIIRKMGTLKTKTAMGPYLALGFICTLLFPVI